MKCNKHGKTKEVESKSIMPIRRTTVRAKSECNVVMVFSERGGLWKIHYQLTVKNSSHKLLGTTEIYRSYRTVNPSSMYYKLNIRKL